MAEQFVWDDKATWPRDRKQFVFLASAVEMYGLAEFGPGWRVTHRQEACLAVADAIADENLRFAVRLKAGGEFSALQPVGVFNSEDALKLFEDCSWPPQWWTGVLETVGPFPFPILSSSYYIFVERRGLDTIIGTIGGLHDAQTSPLDQNRKTEDQHQPPSDDHLSLPATVPAMKRTLERAKTWLDNKRLRPLIKSEADDLLAKMHPGVNDNRNKELDDLRRFLSAAEMQISTAEKA